LKLPPSKLVSCITLAAAPVATFRPPQEKVVFQRETEKWDLSPTQRTIFAQRKSVAHGTMGMARYVIIFFVLQNTYIRS
jgi:hypothetical protein